MNGWLKSKYAIPIITLFLGILATTQLRDFFEGLLFLFASVGQFIAFVFVSRLRQRGSFFWHVIASLGSNGMWYAVMHILDMSHAYWLLIIPYLCAIISGRTGGVQLAQYVEKKYQLKADATRDSKLAPGQRLRYLMEKPTFWALFLGLIGYVFYGSVEFDVEMRNALYIVVVLGVLQNFFYALNTRASQRGNNWFIAITGVLSGTVFFISATYLFSKGMPGALAIPYILSTALGSATGAFFSMIIEWTHKLKPDAHLEKKQDRQENEKNGWKNRIPYVVLLMMGGGWILLQVPIFDMFGLVVTQLQFPIVGATLDLPRAFIVITAAAVFMVDSALHVVASRAGNRDHVGYHVTVLFPKGSADFFKISFLSLNSHIPDIIPIAVIAGCLGSLFGKNISEFIERWLGARMDIPNDEKK